MVALTNGEKAKRYDEITRYMNLWPYSPYTELEFRALEKNIRAILTRPV